MATRYTITGEVAKTVYVETQHGETYRIEAIRETNGNSFSTRVSKLASAIVDSGYIENGKSVKPTGELVWVNVAFPWTDRPTADAAIQQALSLQFDS